MDFTWLGRGTAMGGPGRHRPTHLAARPIHWGTRLGQSELVKRALLQTEILFCFISCPGNWYQMILQVKKTDVDVLGWCGYMVVVVRLAGRTTKFFKMTEAAYGIEMNITFSGNSSSGHSCSQHANCTLPQNVRHLWHCVLWQNCIFSSLLLSPAQGAPA
jgi:hypothetical protein